MFSTLALPSSLSIAYCVPPWNEFWCTHLDCFSGKGVERLSVNKGGGGSTDGVSGNRSTGCVSGQLPTCETLLSGKSSKLPSL